MKRRFIFITCCVDEEFFNPVKKGMHDAAALMNVDCVFKGTEDVDLQEQIKMVRDAVQEGYDGIALNIIDPTAFDDVVRDSMEQGVPVVAFNVDTNSSKNMRLSAVCQNLYQAGRTLGNNVSPYIPDNAKVLITQHSAGISALEDRMRGALDALQAKNLNRKIVVTGMEPEKAAEIVSNELSASSEIKIILCTGQADTEGAGLAVERYFDQDEYTVAGFDLSPNILRLVKSGTIKFTIDQQPYVQGFYPVIQLTHYCKYGILPSNMDAGATVVRQEDVDSLIKLTEMRYR
jgi:simple sugar transport system substrate-binding protein